MFLLFVFLLPASCALAQAPATAPVEAPTTQSTQPATQPAAQPIALADINAEIEAAVATVRGINNGLTDDFINPPLVKELNELKARLDARLEETQHAVGSNASVETLRELWNEWAEAWQPLEDWKKDLNGRLQKLDRDVKSLADLSRHWAEKLKQAKESEAPEDVIKQIQTLLDSIARTRPLADEGRKKVLAHQAQVTQTFNRVNETLQSIKAARDAVVARLVARDDAPIWSGDVRQKAANALAASQNSFRNQLEDLRRYVARYRDTLLAHAVIAFVIIVALFWARRKVAGWIEKEPDLADAFDVFKYPIATGLLATILVSTWLYPQAPRLMWAILGTIMMAPTVVLLRRLLDRRFHRLLEAMAFFWAVDQVRVITASQNFTNRWLFLIEMLLAVIVVLWMIRSGQLTTMVGHLHNQVVRWVTILLRIGGVLCLAAFALNLFGYVGLAKLVGGSTLLSGYTAMILYATAQILDGLIMALLRIWPFTLLQMVRRHRSIIHQRLAVLVRWGLVLWWAWITLELFAVRPAMIGWLKLVVLASVRFGPLELSIWNVASFAFAIWAAFALSKFIRFLLNEDVYPRLAMPRGLPYAISSVLHYTVLLIGFFTAVGSLGYDLTKFTILAGAFGVGLGFGLQNIVNNFVSGIILLFERPLQVGDTIEIDGMTGVVRRIGIRASVIRTITGSELIVPNTRFINEKVTNWTFSSGQRAIGLTLAVEPTAEPKRVMDVLLKTAAANDLITDSPAPQVVMTGFTSGAMTFELQAWTKRYEDWQAARSELAIGVAAALKAAGINVK